MTFAAPRWERGFTLIELLVVMIIIGILAGVAGTAYTAMIGGSPRLETWALTGAAARNQQASIDPRALYDALKAAQTAAREAALQDQSQDPDDEGTTRIKPGPVTVPALLGPDRAPGSCTIGRRSMRGTDITCTRT